MASDVIRVKSIVGAGSILSLTHRDEMRKSRKRLRARREPPHAGPPDTPPYGGSAKNQRLCGYRARLQGNPLLGTARRRAPICVIHRRTLTSVVFREHQPPPPACLVRHTELAFIQGSQVERNRASPNRTAGPFRAIGSEPRSWRFLSGAGSECRGSEGGVTTFSRKSGERPEEQSWCNRLPLCGYLLNGGAEGARTPDPKTASLVLSQLSYSPTATLRLPSRGEAVKHGRYLPRTSHPAGGWLRRRQPASRRSARRRSWARS